MNNSPNHGPMDSMISLNHFKKDRKDSDNSLLFCTETPEKTKEYVKSTENVLKNSNQNVPSTFGEISFLFIFFSTIMIY